MLMKSERKINHGFWATPTDYQRLKAAAQDAGFPIGDYIMQMLDRLNQEDSGKVTPRE